MVTAKTITIKMIIYYSLGSKVIEMVMLVVELTVSIQEIFGIVKKTLTIKILNKNSTINI